MMKIEKVFVTRIVSLLIAIVFLYIRPPQKPMAGSVLRHAQNCVFHPRNPGLESGWAPFTETGYSASCLRVPVGVDKERAGKALEDLNLLKPNSLKDHLAEFGIVVRGSSGEFDEFIDFSNVPESVDWVMDDLQLLREDIIIYRTFDEMPVTELLSPLEDAPVLGRGRGSFRTVYLSIAEINGKLQPIAVKEWFFGKPELEDLIHMQEAAKQGGYPRFFGLIKDAEGNIIGYAMQVIIGKLYEPAATDKNVRRIKANLGGLRLEPSGEWMITRKGKTVGFDGDDIRERPSWLIQPEPSASVMSQKDTRSAL